MSKDRIEIRKFNNDEDDAVWVGSLDFNSEAEAVNAINELKKESVEIAKSDYSYERISAGLCADSVFLTEEMHEEVMARVQ